MATTDRRSPSPTGEPSASGSSASIRSRPSPSGSEPVSGPALRPRPGAALRGPGRAGARRGTGARASSCPTAAPTTLSFRRVGRSACRSRGQRTSVRVLDERLRRRPIHPVPRRHQRRATYGAGRYLVDAAKSHDLGADEATGDLILDFNFATQPSCAFDPRWACPLAPPENRLDIEVRTGERLR